MNDKSNKAAFQPAKFQRPSNQKRFHERTVGERQEKFGQSRAQFSRSQDNDRFAPQDRRSNKDFDRKERQNPAKNDRTFERRNERPIPQETKITETKLGNVKVVMKRSGVSEQPRVKKTGSLSPRAPEKIKKNRAEEMKVYGESACLALFAERPESIVRVWATVEMAHKIGDMFSYLAANKKVYHVVERAELELVSGTEHHGGICMLVKKARPFTLTGYLDIPRQQDALIILDNVRNPQNIGGIIRTCAFYGVKGVIVDNAELLNSAAAMRVAEGGMEYIHQLQTESPDDALAKLRKAGYQVVHTTTNKQAKGVHKLQLAKKVVFVLTESENPALVQSGDEVINLSFANPLKTGLNVAVAAGVLLAKLDK
ncbi:tRNA/rRNA methyltransferase [[Mannheimia] succiniciproducens]|uniref:SpoU protein n=1 Tax=Mannheimia succiniciproducens (strain KCTC 0769BP / MBEL55E) TaxID=221988 RepID=Q65W05_MANSM|nr:tRNA/rRNA methyltransferase [[Mannheimia] succiniciproducens]AAU36855.1 SpoU protein [[Mannheimia] succiniciproducens MBEL55E]